MNDRRGLEYSLYKNAFINYYNAWDKKTSDYYDNGHPCIDSHSGSLGVLIILMKENGCLGNFICDHPEFEERILSFLIRQKKEELRSKEIYISFKE